MCLHFPPFSMSSQLFSESGKAVFAASDWNSLRLQEVLSSTHVNLFLRNTEKGTIVSLLYYMPNFPLKNYKICFHI